jgi:hypothetical protein
MLSSQSGGNPELSSLSARTNHEPGRGQKTLKKPGL